MKKILSVVVVCMMLVTMSFSVFADEATVVEPSTTQNQNGSWTTAGENVAYAGKMMTILVYTKDTTPSVDTIQYIDQTTANSTTGAYSFANYLPKVDPTGTTEYVVKVGGQTLATPLPAGTIQAAEDDATVTGTVNYTGTNTPAKITLTPAEGEALVFTTDAATGAFSITAPKGTYDMVISKPAHTTYTHYGIDVETISGEYTIAAGDTNADTVINVMDISPIVTKLGATVNNDNANSDANDDTVINVMDISPIVTKLGVSSTVINAPAA